MICAVTTACFYDERCLSHDNGSMVLDDRASAWLDVPHFERPERLTRTWSVLEQAGVAAKLHRLGLRRATREDLELVHAPALIDEIEGACARGNTPGSDPRRGSDPKAGSRPSWRPAGCSRSSTPWSRVSPTTGSRWYARRDTTRPPTPHGLLSLQQRRDRRPPCPAPRRRRPGRDRRLGRAPRQRHRGDLLRRPSVLYISLHQDDLYPEGAGTLEHRGAGAGRDTR